MPLTFSFGSMNPTDVILPLLAVDAKINFLGTGFFIGDESFFVTAAHNVESAHQEYRVLNIVDLNKSFPAKIIHIDRPNDIALLNVPGYHPDKRLALASDDQLYYNQQVICLEYGTTIQKGKEIQLSAATRVGNITRIFPKLDLYGKLYINALEISFPALRGASGAPILSDQGFVVLGMVIGNLSYHLIPAQIEDTVDSEGRITEEIKYMLPLGIAVHVGSIREAIKAYLNS